MTFLRLLSEHAYQNFTYNCINSIAWFNAKSEKFDMAVKLKGDDGREFSYNTIIKPLVVRDGCRFREGNAKTVFEIRTKKVRHMPIVDFLPIDYGLQNQGFGFSVGPVCFR